MTVFLTHTHKNHLPHWARLPTRGQVAPHAASVAVTSLLLCQSPVGWPPWLLSFPRAGSRGAQGGCLESAAVAADGWTPEVVAPGQRVLRTGQGPLQMRLHPSPPHSSAYLTGPPIAIGLCWAWPTGSTPWDQRTEGSGVRGVFIHPSGVFRMAASLY